MITICPECSEPLTVEGSGGTEPQHVFCDICGEVEHPADLTSDWNGDTGAHLSCEERMKCAVCGSTEQVELHGKRQTINVCAECGAD